MGCTSSSFIVLLLALCNHSCCSYRRSSRCSSCWISCSFRRCSSGCSTCVRRVALRAIVRALLAVRLDSLDASIGIIDVVLVVAILNLLMILVPTASRSKTMEAKLTIGVAGWNNM